MAPTTKRLGALGDANVIQQVLAHGIEDFADGRLQLDRVVIRRFQQREDGSCLAQYDVQIRDPRDGRRDRQTWVGDRGPSSQMERRQAEALEAPLFRPPLGRPIHRLQEPDLLLWVFPNDPNLKSLITLWEAERFRTYLRTHREDFRIPAGAELAAVRTRCIKYVGTERCTLRHEIALEGGATRIVFSKTTQRLSELRHSFEAMRALHASPELRGVSLTVPEPLLLDPELNAVFASGLEGVNADERLGELDLERVGAQIGAGLAALQQCAIEDLPVLEDSELLRRLPRAEAVIGASGDELRGRIQRLGARLGDLATGMPSLPARPVHGAFRLSQLLVTPKGLGLVDFDHCALGDPIFDLGSFVAYLVYLARKGKLCSEGSAACIGSFCREYARKAPWGLPDERLRWHVAAQLVTKHARRSAGRNRKKRADLTAPLLEAAEAILDGELELS